MEEVKHHIVLSKCVIMACRSHLERSSAGLLSYDVDVDDNLKKLYDPPNLFGGDDSKR